MRRAILRQQLFEIAKRVGGFSFFLLLSLSDDQPRAVSRQREDRVGTEKAEPPDTFAADDALEEKRRIAPQRFAVRRDGRQRVANELPVDGNEPVPLRERAERVKIGSVHHRHIGERWASAHRVLPERLRDDFLRESGCKAIIRVCWFRRQTLSRVRQRSSAIGRSPYLLIVESVTAELVPPPRLDHLFRMARMTRQFAGRAARFVFGAPTPGDDSGGPRFPRAHER